MDPTEKLGSHQIYEIKKWNQNKSNPNLFFEKSLNELRHLTLAWPPPAPALAFSLFPLEIHFMLFEIRAGWQPRFQTSRKLVIFRLFPSGFTSSIKLIGFLVSSINPLYPGSTSCSLQITALNVYHFLDSLPLMSNFSLFIQSCYFSSHHALILIECIMQPRTHTQNAHPSRSHRQQIPQWLTGMTISPTIQRTRVLSSLTAAFDFNWIMIHYIGRKLRGVGCSDGYRCHVPSRNIQVSTDISASVASLALNQVPGPWRT